MKDQCHNQLLLTATQLRTQHCGIQGEAKCNTISTIDCVSSGHVANHGFPLGQVGTV